MDPLTLIGAASSIGSSIFGAISANKERKRAARLRKKEEAKMKELEDIYANLDTSKGFITVIPEEKIGDIAFVESEIVKNREYSAANREEVLEYGKTFEWSNVVSKYYVPAMKQIIERYQ